MGKPKSVRKGRRSRGTGSIFPDARRGGWVSRVPVGRKADGRLKYRELRAPTMAAVIEAAKAVRAPGPRITLAEWAPRWLAALDVRPKSRDIYLQNLRLRVLPALGSLPVADITPFHVEEAVRRWGSAVGATTVRLTLATLSACLQGAVRAEITPRNPARVVRRPRPVDAPHDPFTAAELRTVIDACLPDPRLHPFALCAATGCRIGEALARDPADYDPATHRLAITKTVSRGHGIGPPKSRHSLRTIAVPALVRPTLTRPVESRSYDTAQGRWDRLLVRLGLRHRGVHQLRHSVASLLLARGEPLADVARYLGDSVAVLVKTYVHPTDRDVAGAISDLLAGPKSGAEVAPKGQKGGKSRAKPARPIPTR
jgi:integrase